MKTLIVLCFIVASVYSLPAKKTDVFNDSEETFFMIPFTRQHKEKVPTVVEVDVGDSSEEDSIFSSYFRPLFFNPFSFMNFGFSDFFSRPSWFDSLLPKGIPEDAKKNSTSVTQVINGHKITVNKTTYENEDNGSIFRLQVIEVSPVESKEKKEPIDEKEVKKSEENAPEQLDTRTQTTEEAKPDQNSLDNEIHREEMIAKYELQDDPSIFNHDIEMINLGKRIKKRKEGDLSDDIRVNAILSENNRRGGLFMIPSEVEVFDTLDYNQLADNYQQQENQQIIIQPKFDAKYLQNANLNAKSDLQ